jgi:hypothetical protein
MSSFGLAVADDPPGGGQRENADHPGHGQSGQLCEPRGPQVFGVADAVRRLRHRDMAADVGRWHRFATRGRLGGHGSGGSGWRRARGWRATGRLRRHRPTTETNWWCDDDRLGDRRERKLGCAGPGRRRNDRRLEDGCDPFLRRWQHLRRQLHLRRWLRAAGRGLDDAATTTAATTGLRPFARVGAGPGRLFARFFLAWFFGFLARVFAPGLGVWILLLTRSGLLFGPFTAAACRLLAAFGWRPAAAIPDTRARRAIARSPARADGLLRITGVVLVARAITQRVVGALILVLAVALPAIGKGDGTATANEQPRGNETGSGGDTDTGSHLSAPLTASPAGILDASSIVAQTASTVC